MLCPHNADPMVQKQSIVTESASPAKAGSRDRDRRDGAR
jgi:hypothetical protein